MYVPVDSQKSCARAWVAAASAIAQSGEAYNVIIDVQDPSTHDDSDHAVISLVNQFLKDQGEYPISTVANTIFPQALYKEHGAPVFYDKYLEVYGRLTSSKQWGRYFERMIRHQKADGELYNPLDVLVERLRGRQDSTRYTSAYELAVYDLLQDGRAFRGRQCLSFLSFKLHPQYGICLTAMYRNHTYITRCLGNLIGLGRLQTFIAHETGFPVGHLTCISTHAALDTSGSTNSWGIVAARNLIADAAKLYDDEKASNH